MSETNDAIEQVNERLEEVLNAVENTGETTLTEAQQLTSHVSDAIIPDFEERFNAHASNVTDRITAIESVWETRLEQMERRIMERIESLAVIGDEPSEKLPEQIVQVEHFETPMVELPKKPFRLW